MPGTGAGSSVSTRLATAALRAFLLVQCAVAAGVAWWLAADVIGHVSPFFAPVVAVVCLGMSYGQRQRRVLEVAIGVAVGVFVADVFVQRGGQRARGRSRPSCSSRWAPRPSSTAGPVLVTQAAVQGIVVAALGATPGQAFTRWTDALIGGGVALVAATVVPQAPLRRPRVAAAEAVRKISELLRGAEAQRRTTATSTGRPRCSPRPAARSRCCASCSGAADEGLSVIASSPFKRRHAPHVRKMVELVEPLDRAMRSTRVLVRRITVSVGRGEPLPTGLPPAHARARRRRRRHRPGPRRERLARDRPRPDCSPSPSATGRLPRTESLATETVLAQLRSVVVDLLQVTGLDVDDAVAAHPAGATALRSSAVERCRPASGRAGRHPQRG